MDAVAEAAPTPDPSEPSTPYSRWADIFARAHNDTQSIAVALEVVDAIREEEGTDPPPVTHEVDRILAIVARLFDMPVKRLRERSRRQDVTSARYVAAMLLRRRRWTTTKLGHYFGLDHSTIVYGLQKVANTHHLLIAAAKVEHLLRMEVEGASVIPARAKGRCSR